MMIIDLLQLLSACALGLLVGSLLTEAMILVPYWRTMQAEEFLRLHSTLGPRLFIYFAPLTILGTALPVLAAVVPLMLGAPWDWLLAVPAQMVLIMLAIYFAYFAGANESFKSGSMGLAGLAAELARWANWHWLRVALGMTAFVTSLWVLLCHG